MAAQGGNGSNETDEQNEFRRQFEALYHRHFDRLFRYSYAIVLDQCMAEDVVSEVFMNCWYKREDLQQVNNMEAYLVRSVKHLSLRKISTDLFKRSLNQCEEKSAAGDDDPELIYLGEELQEIIVLVSEGLSPHARIVYDMSRNQGYSKKQIAEELGITIRAVDKHLSKIVEHFRTALKVRFTDTNTPYFFMARSLFWGAVCAHILSYLQGLFE